MIVRALDGQPVLERDIGAEDVQDVCLSDRGDVDVVVRIIVGTEQRRPRVLAMIIFREMHDGGVVVDDG